MCSIIGYCGKPFRYKDFSEGFARTVSRGPDDTQIITAGQGVLGFHRLSIMGLHPEGMQPFQLHGNALVCNGEIFEKYYHGQGQMIVDFWMPNKEGEGCNVTDPSARVLSNYGASGK